MKKDQGHKILAKLLLSGQNNQRLYGAWFALFIGSTLLLAVISLWSIFHQVLEGGKNKDSLGSTYLTISRKIGGNSDQSGISQQDLQQLLKAPQVQDAGLLQAANFKVAASLGSGPMSFYTLLFFEAAPDRFMDEIPERWQWQEGELTIPIILSRDFLNMYNYIFAPSQGLPVLSEQSVQALGFSIIIGEGENQREYRAQVEGFSDRISSVLVPESFIAYGNKTFGQGEQSKASRAIIKVKDPSDQTFVSWLKSEHYTTNAEQLRFNKMRSLVETVSSSIGLLALILMALGIIIFILFIELTLSKAQQSIQLLLLIGHQPKSIGNYLLKRYIPIMLSALLAALCLVLIANYLLITVLKNNQLPAPGIPVMGIFGASLFSALILLWQSNSNIRKSLLQK